ncbi:MAG TPA: rRNA adenine N-6-methyltransferase family protein, partial [Verrucomicrobiae bacterium]
PALIVATLQLEVAKRLMAQAGSEDYGLLTLLVQSKFRPDGLFKIPASCFFPAPDVDSACVKLRLHGTPLMNESERVVFDKVIRRGFSQRRKMLYKLLKEDWSEEKLKPLFASLNLDLQIRAENVTLETFVEIAKRLATL